MAKISGIRLFGDLTLKKGFAYNTNHKVYTRKIKEIIVRNGFSMTGESYHRFEDDSFSYAIMLCESHVAVHTWPNDGFFTFDLHVCNFSRDNHDPAWAPSREIARLLGWDEKKYSDELRQT